MFGHFHLTFACFQIEERRDRGEQSLVRRADDGGRGGGQGGPVLRCGHCWPGSPQWSPGHRGPSGQPDQRSVSQCWTVTQCRAPEPAAEPADTIHSGVQARNVIKSHKSHMSPMSHVGVIPQHGVTVTNVVIVWLMIVSMR